jgi:hypothetical protein
MPRPYFQVHENRIGLGRASFCKSYFDRFLGSEALLFAAPMPGDYGKALPGPRHTPRAAKQIEIRSSAGT